MTTLKKCAIVSSTILFLGCSIIGCSKTSTTNTTATTITESTNATQAATTSTEYGKVTAIDDTTVTLSLGTLQSPDFGSAPDESTSPSGNKIDSASAPPEKPSGNTPSNEKPSGEKPSGGAPDGQKPSEEAPAGGMGNFFLENGSEKIITLDDTVSIKLQSGSTVTNSTKDSISIDSLLLLTYDGDGTIATITIMDSSAGTTLGSSSNSETGSISLNGTKEINATTETSHGETFRATAENKNVVLVKAKGSFTLAKATLTKSGDSTDIDESNFFGLNSVFAVVGGSSANISDVALESSGEGSNAIFASGTGSNLSVSNVTIETTGDSSRGLDATYGGTIVADHVTITTSGSHCAPIATDRGEGTIHVDSGTLAASGDGSPCIYSTGAITATNLTGVATDSQCAVVEGKNSITLANSNLTGAGLNGLMLYQSSSGDASKGTATFDSTDSTLTTTSSGPMFYITNTDAEINLTNTILHFTSGNLLTASGNNTNNWGTPGENGGNVILNATDQLLEGAIQCDTISTIALNLLKNATFTGSLDSEHTGDISICLDTTSIWNVTKDSYLSSITDSDVTVSNIRSNGYTIYYDATNSGNHWLEGKTISLSGGGELVAQN